MKTKFTFYFVLMLLFSINAIAAIPPASLSLQGTATETGASIPMKLNGNVYELYTSLKTGDYSFAGDNTIATANITVTGTLVPHRIRVDYSGATPVVDVKRIQNITLWAPWNAFSIGTLSYVGNSSFKATGLSGIAGWGDDRYRIRLNLEGGVIETFQPGPSASGGVPDGSTPQSYYDLYFLNSNDKWPGGAKEYKIASKYNNTGTLFNAEVIFSNTSNYTHKITDYVADLVIADNLTISGSALETTTAVLKKKDVGVFEFVGGLQAGSFTISGTANSQTYNYTVTNNTVVEGNTALAVTGVLKPYYIKIDLVNKTFVRQEINSVYLYMSSNGWGGDKLLLPYTNNGKFTGTKVSPVWPATMNDERYKIKMDLANGASVFWGSVNFDNPSRPADNLFTGPLYGLYSVNSDDYQYSYKFRGNTKNQQIAIELDFNANGAYNHRYEIGATLPLDLIDFKAIPTNGKINLVWKTENEVNFKEFEVERSINGLSFTTIGNKPTNKLAGPQTYSFTDHSIVTSSTLYYRLKIVDNDGTYKYSEIEAVKLPSLSKAHFKAWSTGSSLQIQHPTTENNAEVKVFSVSGNLLTKVSTQKGYSSAEVNIASLAAGVYVVVFKDGHQQYTSKFVK
ncbi:T9SS type A sorting domain-containing protein [Pedobacter xixiisoli]|uniref:Por secretion system C-terminal sorting domain-containing protein n=1 Tax=Pedobacter xixiisoli TaxID=1476464 RepID=A0A286A0F0_9SPHI|nr:T9SS type A sorting domain-containing protein [Pedobacter xixiisoli]SOD15341.1 Por secretion system C-terminal sorting domain-containing protein [Pedobacter xixiisoli]